MMLLGANQSFRSFQFRPNQLNSLFPGQTRVVRGLSTCPEELGGNDEIGTLEVELLDHTAHLELRLASRVNLGGVEHVDAGIEGGLNDVLDGVANDGSAKGEPCESLGASGYRGDM